MSRFFFLRVFYYAFLNFIFFGFYWGTLIYLPYYFKQVGVSEARIGFLVSEISLTTLIMIFPLGILSDRIDAKKLFLSGALIGIIFSLLLLKNGSVKGFEPYMFIFSLGTAMLSISLSAHFLKQIAESGRGSQSAIFNIGGLLGAGLGSELSGQIIRHFGDAYLFWLTLGFAVLLFLGGLALPKIKGIPFRISEYKEDLQHPLSWILLFIVLIVASHTGFEHAGYTLLQTQEIGLSPLQVGRIFLYISIWMSLVSYLSGRTYDRTSKPVLWAGLALLVSGIFQSASGYGQGFSDFFIYRALHTAGDSFSSVLMLVIASMVFARKRAGGAWAILLLGRNLSDFIFANLAGQINQELGFRAGFLISGIILFFAGILVIFVLRPFFWKEIKQIEENKNLVDSKFTN